ncbi:hypothetical protein BpHYR1_053824 [Brachionus plicatilis]|uniref:Uncharacterized protein n=1 Tax=Brachionus plicatilis TaxID=10195 RepID=A0A3M7R4Q8_BRAPC|nr:hypothetical protein BpHYR1_053824 [Brachionus plicatilis]
MHPKQHIAYPYRPKNKQSFEDELPFLHLDHLIKQCEHSHPYPNCPSPRNLKEISGLLSTRRLINQSLKSTSLLRLHYHFSIRTALADRNGTFGRTLISSFGAHFTWAPWVKNSEVSDLQAADNKWDCNFADRPAAVLSGDCCLCQCELDFWCHGSLRTPATVYRYLSQIPSWPCCSSAHHNLPSNRAICPSGLPDRGPFRPKQKRCLVSFGQLLVRLGQCCLVGLRRLSALGQRVERISLGHLLNYFLCLHLEPFFQVSFLLLIQVVKVTADVADGALKFMAVKLSRVNVGALAQKPELGHLLLVNGIHKWYLLFQGLLFVLQFYSTQGLLVQVLQQTL